MKHFLNVFTLAIICLTVKGQPLGQEYPCSFLPPELECYTTSWFDTIDIETNLNLFHLDTIDTTNVWQFGTSPKAHFDSAYGFVTDTINPYPINHRSILEYRMPRYDGVFTILMFEHKYQTDSLIDGGYLQVSCDNGQSWDPLGQGMFGFNTCSYAYAYYNYPDINGNLQSTIQDTIHAFTGTSDWTWTAVELWEPSAKTGGVFDSIYFRFIFESDSIDSGKSGWMIRNIVNAYADGCYCGIDENSNINELEYYPNPSSGKIQIDVGVISDQVTINTYSMTGKLLQTKVRSTGGLIQYDLPDKNGVYLIQLVYTDGRIKHLKVLKE